ASGGERRGAVEDADVVEAEKTALEDVLSLGVLAVHPPGEVQQELVEDALEEGAVRAPADALLDLVDSPDGPGVHGRIHGAEGPLVGGEQAARVHVPLTEEERELILGEVGVD